MNGWDIGIVIGVAAAIFFALRHMVRSGKEGCCGSCEQCGASCTGRKGDTGSETKQ